jgi:hypothetical protein
MFASISSKFIKGLGIFYGIDDKVVYHKLRYIFNGIDDKIVHQKLRMSMDFLMEVGRSNLIFWYEYYNKKSFSSFLFPQIFVFLFSLEPNNNRKVVRIQNLDGISTLYYL